jgi:nucleoside-triphosphatase THEP1
VYIPGARELALMLLFALALVLAVATQSPAAPILVAAAVAAWLAARSKERILAALYRERSLLLAGIEELKFIEDPRAPISYAALRVRKQRLYGFYLRVRDCDPVRSSPGRAAERALAALHHPSARVTVLAVLREGSYEYYLGLWASDLRTLSSAAGDIVRAALSAGLYAAPADARATLSTVALVNERKLPPRPPFLALAAAASIAVSALGQPLLALAAIPIAPLLLDELRIARGGWLPISPPPARQLVNTVFSVDEASISAMLRSVSAVAQAAPPRTFVAAALQPADSALVEARAKTAMEVLDAARAGASRLREELKAARWLQVWRALQDGAAPFTALAVASEELARELEKCGLRPASRTPLTALRALIPLGGGELLVSHQLAWLAPHAFMRPRTRRTPKAIYLGRGLRRDEEVWLELDLLENVHGLIVGPMGSGKSTTARTVALRALERGIVPIIVDPSGEYRRFADKLGWEIVDLTDNQLDISACQASDLRRAFDYVSPLSDWEFLELRRALEEGDLWSAKLAALEIVKPYFRSANVVARQMLETGKPFVLCMGSAASGRYVPMPVEVQRFAFAALLAQLRDYVLAEGLSEPRWMLIVDEGHLFARAPRGEAEAPATTVARMLRKFGLAVVVLTHDWHDADPAFLRHCGWRLALSHSDPNYVEETRVYMALTPTELSWFQRGVRGRAVLRRGHEPHNILIEVEPEELAKPEIYSTR